MHLPLLHCPRSRPSLLLAGIVFLCIALAGPLPAKASETFKIIPAVTAQEMYDSNVYMKGKGDMEHRLAPSLKFELKEERIRGNLNLTGTGYKYTTLSEFDRIDQKYELALEADATERLKASLASSAIVDHTFSATLEDTGQIAKMTLRRVKSIQPTLTYQVTERNSATVFGGFSQTTYGSKQYTDSNNRSLGGRWGYMATERLQLIGQVTNARMDQDNADQTVLTALGGGEYNLTETLKARFLVGMSSLKSSNTSGRTNSSGGYSADSSLQWRGETHDLSATFVRDMTAGLNGEDIVRTRFGFSGSKNLTERLKLRLSSNLVISKTTGDFVTEKTTRWVEIRPSASYQTSEHSTLSLGYGFGTQHIKETEEVKSRSQVFLNFSISFP